MIDVIGAGLAGCEAALQIANRGILVNLYEMKPQKYTPAHHYHGFAELVCSNSLKAMRIESAAGLLKEEMKLFGSVMCQAANFTSVPAGGALAVDREAFSNFITDQIKNHPNINVISQEVSKLPMQNITVVATGPLTSEDLSKEIGSLMGEGYLSFFDAAAPIITADSLNMDKVYAAARYDRGDADYLNCPMNKEEYERFYTALTTAQKAPLHEFEQGGTVYEGCMPVEVMASRGVDTLRFGPLRPVGLRDPNTGHRPWAVVQLRKENTQGTLYNLVGFQTNLKFGEQKRVFSLIPGLENAEFVRYGVMHRNTFLNSPKLLNASLQAKNYPNLFFAGQLIGTEGYVESAADGIFAGINAARLYQGKPLLTLPKDCMMGALFDYVSNPYNTNFQPMGANMGILPPPPQKIKDKKQRYGLVANQAYQRLKDYLADTQL